MIILKDGVRYNLWTPKNEVNDFEPMIIHHVKDIFGPGCEYFPKQKLKTLANNRSIPDGFVVDFNNKKWYIVELKLLGDDAIRRITVQIVDYKNALKNIKTRREIYKTIKKIINTDFLDDLIIDDKPGIVILIDSLYGDAGNQFSERVKGTDSSVQIIEFKTYNIEGNDLKKTHIHSFNPLYDIPLPEEIRRTKKFNKRKPFGGEEIIIKDLILKSTNAEAKAIYLGGKVQVQKGAIGVLPQSSLTGGYLRIFKEMENEGAIERLKDKPGYWKLKKQKEFSSPSAAASILMGGSRNGKICWMNKKKVLLGDLIN